MGWVQQQFLGSLVIIFGTGNNTGLFVYNGTPALGNAPIFWATSGTADPYGNALPATAGVGSGGTFEVDGTETVVGTLNVSGTETVSGTLNVSGPGNLNVIGTETITGTLKAGNTRVNTSGVFVYSGTPAAGNLIGSVAPAAGTDAFGNAFAIGVNSYVVVGGVTYAVGLNLVGANGFAGLSIQDNTNLPNLPCGVFGQASNGSVKRARATLASGVVLGTDTPSTVTVGSATDSGTPSGLIQANSGQVTLGAVPTVKVMDTTGAVLFNNPASAPANPGIGAAEYTTTAGTLNYVNSGDAQNYNIGHHETSAAGNQLINSTTPTLVTGSTLNVGISTYRIKWTVFYKGGQAAGAPIFSIGGTSTTSFSRWRNIFTTTGAPASFSAGLGSAFVAMTGPTLLNGALQSFEFEVFITFSASGTFTLLAAESINLDTFTIDSIFSRMEPRQVS